MTTVPQTDEKTITAWVTKYALTSGIFKVSAELSRNFPSMISWRDVGSQLKNHAHGKDWHRTEADAIKRANEMRDKKIASLKKQIEAISAMKFEAKE